MKKSILFTIILFVLIMISIILIISDFNSGQLDKMDKELVLELEDKVTDYLFEKGYTEEEIYDLEVKFNPKIGYVPDAYSVYVVFEDDKKMTYVYEERSGDIIQVGFSGSNDGGKHLEKRVVEDESVE